jgi:hypothetical protein
MTLVRISLLASLLAALAFFSAATILRAQSSDESPNRTRVPMVTDWSHRHLVFSHTDAHSKSSSPEDLRLQGDRRFHQQVARRRAMTHSTSLTPTELTPASQPTPSDSEVSINEGSLSRDWTSSLASFGTVGNEQYPAKFEFNINAAVTTANCTSDFVVYNNNNASGTHTGFIQNAINIGIFWGVPPVGSTITITAPATGRAVTFTAVADTTTPAADQFQVGTTSLMAAANLAAAVNVAELAAGGVTGTFPYTAHGHAGNEIFFTDVATSGTDSGAGGNNTSDTPINCFPFAGNTCAGNFTFFSGKFFSGRGGTTAAVANLIGLMNLYSGTPAGICPGTGPTVKFAYGISTAQGVTTTSPALSEDGTQIGIVESTSVCHTGETGCTVGSVLHLVKWKNASGTLATPVVPQSVTAANYRSCAAPCMVNVNISASSDSNSAPFIDYTNDRIYVGDDSGKMAEVNGVFLGTPSLGWQTTVDAGFALTGPVFDAASGNIFVADANGVVSTVVASNGALGPQIYTSGVTGKAGFPIPDPPIVDSTAETVTAFVSNDTSGGAELVQYPIDFQPPLRAFVVGPAGVQMHDGDFDNTYYSGDSYQYGYLYFCGKNPGSSVDNPAIERASFDSNGILESVDGESLNVSNLASAECSPVTEVYNAGVDYIFFSVQTGGNGQNCTTLGGSGVADSNPSAGCVMSVIVADGSSTQFPTPMPTAINSSLGEPGGSSGIILDNVSAAAQASSIYFSPLSYVTSGTANGNCPTGVGCAVKATQSGLN